MRKFNMIGYQAQSHFKMKRDSKSVMIKKKKVKEQREADIEEKMTTSWNMNMKRRNMAQKKNLLNN